VSEEAHAAATQGTVGAGRFCPVLDFGPGAAGRFLAALFPSNMPETTWKSMSQRWKTALSSGTQQAQQFASHSLVSVLA